MGSWRQMITITFFVLTLGDTALGSIPWRPCTADLRPLDFLSRVLPRDADQPATSFTGPGGGARGGGGVQLVQDGGLRGAKFVGPHRSLSFPASQLFINCHRFPAEFSIIITMKLDHLAPKASEYIFTMVTDVGNRLLLGLKVSRDRLHFLFQGSEARKKLSFRRVSLADGRWHTLVLALSGQHATLTIDCGMPLEMVHKKPFPTDLSTEGSKIYVGNRKRWKGVFSGLLRQLVLLPGSDATPRICPSSNPRLAELAVPAIFGRLPVQVRDNDATLPPYESEVRVIMGSNPSCTGAEKGRLWFDIQKKGLYLCDGAAWMPMLQDRERLDYVDDHQDVFTSSETYDIEVFHVPSMGLFAAMAHRSGRPGSGIYRWNAGRFQLYQNISTCEAVAWKHFTVGKKVFLAVSNSRGPVEGGKEVSVIYKWNFKKLKFVRYQSLETHSARDWEAFTIHNDTFLAVANHRKANGDHNIDSVVYKWNAGSKSFEVNQTLLTSGAYDWESFSIGPYHFLAVANAFDGVSTFIESTIYIWMGGAFQPFQSIRTLGATDWEMFRIGDRFFLAVANGHMLYDKGPSLYAINSTIYELDMLTQMFLPFQNIGTYSAVDWEFFTVGDDKFLVVANSYDGATYSLNSVIYRWQGYEGFIPVHRLPTIGCSDWEFFSSSEGAFLIYSSAKQPLSKVFKLKTN
ncbi:thrombospondin-type laminin G domain and EAR repeat-containing protein [Engraulis encrasicolus]|uniref:thrombospondin-type laminin G domain and EAR repeat-containing protein n=1 Tax=Engraulis encrasicolus TaxID=184585 RepID=UPI002FD25209